MINPGHALAHIILPADVAGCGVSECSLRKVGGCRIFFAAAHQPGVENQDGSARAESVWIFCWKPFSLVRLSGEN